MAKLTLRTLLAYIDDTLEPGDARQLGEQVAQSEIARELIERIKKVTRRRGIHAPVQTDPDDEVSDPNTVAEYLNDVLGRDRVTELEDTCLHSDVHLAEVAACHQILTLLLTEPVRVPPRARQRMYALLPPPASSRKRRPGKTIPVGGVVPAPPDRAEHDDADVGLLLGMARYSTGSTRGRLRIVGAVVGLSILLACAVLMALPQNPPPPPETSPGPAYAGTPGAPAPAPTPPVTPPPKAEPKDVPTKIEPKVDAPKVDATPKPDMTPKADPPKPPENAVELGKKAPPPREDRVPVGKVVSPNVIVLTRADDGPAWLRLDPAGEAAVTSHDQVLCLPGYKATVALDTGVTAHLWANVPELFPARLLETRVRFHRPERKAEGGAEDFDADLTLLAGRVYLKAARPTGARVRVRFAGEVWDVTLPDDQADVAVEVSAAFDPGTPFAREGGQPPRTEARVAVVAGAAGLTLPERFKRFEKVTARAVVAWDSKGAQVAEPAAVEPGNMYYDRFPIVVGAQGQAVQKALTDMAGRLTERNGARTLLAELLSEPPEAGRVVHTQLAVYAQAAIVYRPAAADELKPLVDLLTDETRLFARLAVTNALSAWVARDPGNTALLGQVLEAKLRREGEPELVLRLLRGYVPRADPDPAALDRLVDLLTHPSVAVRQLALWNLLNFVDPAAVRTTGMVADVGNTADRDYDKFVKAWRARVDEIKQKQPGKM